MRIVPLSENRIIDLCVLWNQELAAIFPMRERILKQNIFQDRNVLPEGSWMALDEESNDIVGFIVAKVWQDSVEGLDFGNRSGWIHCLLINSNYRGRGIGGELLKRAENAMRLRGVQVISIGGDFHWRVFPGIPDNLKDVQRFFSKKGYSTKETVHDLLNRYDPGASAQLPQFDKVTFRLARQDDREKLVAFITRCFSRRWDYQTRQYWERGGTGREFVVLEKEGDVIGFCRINDSHSPILAQNVYWEPLFASELGGIGPLGIDKQFRGLNYGLAIVQAGIHFLLERGILQIVIDTTPYVDFYGKLGYTVWKTYSAFEKQLEP